MTERLSPFEQKQFRDSILRDIETRRVSPFLNMCFRRFWDLKSRIESGEGFWITDLWDTVEFHMGFKDVFGSDVDMVLTSWRAAEKKQSLIQSDP